MESFSFHFERMNNLDLHPLSLPISRLSPAKSNSSIVEQLAHHQHGKGDSAYSSFSGGSTAQDYPSPFIPDDLQPSSLSHYADIKYVRAIYQPSQVLQSHSKTMDQLCLSVEAISQQYHHNNNNINDHRQNGHNKYLTNKKKSFQEDVAPTQFPPPPIRPPPPPARLDSFVATRNLENSWGHHQGTELKPQQAQTQKQQMPYKLHPQAQRQSALKPQTANLDPGTSGLRSELVYGGWCDPQEPPQTLQPLSYRPHLQHTDRTSNSLNPEHLFTTNNKEACEQQQQQKLGNMLSRSPPQVMSQTEHQKHKPPASIGGGNGSSHFEGKHKRAHSTHGCLGPELNRVASPWNVGPNLINSSIQHKGHFYFITGMCKPTESGVRMHSPCVSEAGSETSTVVETYRLKEKDRCHSTMEHFFRPPQHRSYKSNDMIPNENQVATQDSFISSSHDENHNTMSKGPSPVLIQSSHSFDSLEQIDLTQSQEMARHTSNHPIFYCGPQENCPPQANRQIQEVIPIPRNEQLSLGKTEEQSKRGRKQQLGDVASKKINKETTPLLYHLTGASRVALKPKNDFDLNVKGKEAIFNKTGRKEFTINNKGRSPQGESVKEDQGEVFSHACNTLDDSFKKYYKERLKDAQSKVLRETSFKRRDLQLSWPHRIKQQKPEQRPSVIHSFSPSQDSETSTNTLTPSVTSVETEMGSVKEEVREKEKEKDSERENTRPVNMAQPQVARIGGRKRLTPEQKKMCYSEPEKLNQLGDAPSHSTCRSLGNEAENVFQMHCKRDEAAQHGEQPMGLVAARRKMFETRGRALSASSLSKTNLKHLQHKALVEYIERKTGQKVAEPQQPGPQLPPPSRQRHSIGEKPFDWSAKVQAASTGSKGPKNKLNRPHSAGRILDSSTSSIRYAQFFSAPFGSVQSSGQPIWKENKGPSQGKSASAENLLEQPEPVPEFLRNRSTSTPHAFQAHSHEKEPSVADAIETHSPQETTEEECLARPTPEGQQRIRINAQRGKSMEELGSSRFTRTLALSKSSEQLDQLQSHPRGPEKESNRVLFCGSGQGETDLNQKMGRKQQLGLEQAGLGLENIGRGKTRAPGKVENQAIKNPLSKRDLTSLLGSGEGAEPPVSTKDSPIIINSSQAMVHSSFPGSNGSATDELGVGPCSDTSNPPSPKGQDTSEKEIKSTSSTPSLPNQTEVPKESKLSSSFTSDGDQTSQSVTSMQEVEAIGATPPLDSNQEVSLSCGVTTDPLLWILAADQETEEESQSPPLTDNVFEVEPTSSASLMQKTEAPLSLSTSASDVNISHAVKGEKIPETMDEKSEEDHVLGESGTPEGETESSKEPDDKPQWEELVEAVVKVDQSLTRVLYPLTNRKTALMLMEQLLSEDTLLMEEHYKKKQEQRGATEIADSLENVESLPALPASDDHTAPCSEPHSEADITEKKHLLVAYIEERLLAMHEMRHALQTEIQENAVRGEAMLGLVRDRCPPVEVERYGLFIGDLERVVSLLLCLSARLARVQNALSTVDQHTDAEEKQSLDSRHRLLCKQRDDAKDLKDNLDRRESLVSTFLSRQLSERQLQDYRCFVQTQASLLIRQKDLEERQRLGEEQLEALRSSLPPP